MTALFQAVFIGENCPSNVSYQGSGNESERPKTGFIPGCRALCRVVSPSGQARSSGRSVVQRPEVRCEDCLPAPGKIDPILRAWYNLILPCIYVIYTGKKNKVILSRGHFILASLRMMWPAEYRADPHGAIRTIASQLVKVCTFKKHTNLYTCIYIYIQAYTSIYPKAYIYIYPLIPTWKNPPIISFLY